jgi:Zn-dependent protease with chaperone function
MAGAIPHIYVFPGSLNMAYIAGSTSADGRGKIVVGQQAVELFDASSLKGFVGHEMAHLVSDTAAQGCNDYILRDPQIEVEADALAVRTLGSAPVKAFLQRVLVLTKGQNWEPNIDLNCCNDLDTATIARFFPRLPSLAASFRPHLRKADSGPKRLRM